jgi:hypothetical protein
MLVPNTCVVECAFVGLYTNKQVINIWAVLRERIFELDEWPLAC